MKGWMMMMMMMMMMMRRRRRRRMETAAKRARMLAMHMNGLLAGVCVRYNDSLFWGILSASF
jgi:hypothetical protein